MGAGIFVPPGGNPPMNDPGISGQNNPSPALSSNVGIAVQKLRSIIQQYAQQQGLTQGTVKEGEVSPARVPQIQGTIPGSGINVNPVPTFQPNQTPPMKYEFQTAAGRDAQNAYNIMQGFAQGVEKIKAKKAQGEANQGYLITKMYLDAYQNNDQNMMNAIAENPKYQKVLEDAFGMELPTMGKEQQKPEKPNPTKAGAMKAIQQHVAKQGPQNLPSRTSSITDQAAAEQAKLQGQMANATSQVLGQPGVAQNVGAAALGQAMTPVEQAQAEAAAGKVMVETYTKLAQMQNDMDIAIKNNKAKIDAETIAAKSRLGASAMTEQGRILAAEIERDGRMQAALQRSMAALKVGATSKAIPDLLNVGKSYLEKAQDLTAKQKGGARNIDDKDIQDLYSKAEDMFRMAGDISQAAAMPQEDAFMSGVAKKYGFQMKSPQGKEAPSGSTQPMTMHFSTTQSPGTPGAPMSPALQNQVNQFLNYTQGNVDKMVK